MENFIWDFLNNVVFGYFKRMIIEGKIEEVIPTILSFGDKTTKIMKNYELEDEKYLRVVITNFHWRNGIRAISVLVNEKNHNLRIFAYTSETESYELMYFNLVQLAGLPADTNMNLQNLKLIYTRFRQNYLGYLKEKIGTGQNGLREMFQNTKKD